MNFKSKLVSVFGAGIIALSMVGGVAANNQVDVNVQVNKPENGTLTYSLQADGFSSATASFESTSKSEGKLTLTVTDNRFTFEGWTITMSATDFTSQGKKTINANALTVKPNGNVQIKNGGPDSPVAREAQMSNQGAPVLQASRGQGSGEYVATYDATVAIPANTQAGVYKTTITVSQGAGPN